MKEIIQPEAYKAFLTERQIKGYQTELHVQWLLDLASISYEGNPKDPVAWLCSDAFKEKEERRTDLKIHYNHQEIYAEVKSNQYRLCPTHFRRDVLPRYLRSDPEHRGVWHLYLTNKNLMSEGFRELCKEYGIEVYEIGRELYQLYGINYPYLTCIKSSNSKCFDIECSDSYSVYFFYGLTVPAKGVRFRTRLRSLVEGNRFTSSLVRNLDTAVKRIRQFISRITFILSELSSLEGRTFSIPPVFSLWSPMSRDIENFFRRPYN